jgi:hypothetical protein
MNVVPVSRHNIKGYGEVEVKLHTFLTLGNLSLE